MGEVRGPKVRPAGSAPSSDKGSKSPWGASRGEGLRFPDGSAGKEFICNAEDTGDSSSIPGLGRCPGGRNGNPLQYSCLKNFMDRGAWQATVQRVTKDWTQLGINHNLRVLNMPNYFPSQVSCICFLCLEHSPFL